MNNKLKLICEESNNILAVIEFKGDEETRNISIGFNECDEEALNRVAAKMIESRKQNEQDIIEEIAENEIPAESNLEQLRLTVEWIKNTFNDEMMRGLFKSMNEPVDNQVDIVVKEVERYLNTIAKPTGALRVEAY